ncbi:hypothetical protein KO498_08165 [Lentibacter algarum]|uniref:hypothetical protein n=1 Tax=Lentibacter algarum TaxID=576131 RepID=UPI001C072AB6|nr:hypothetical protein [Lentibacter algarum]MBU2981789.1 hypothetical protein [Lentibacter algarum]
MLKRWILLAVCLMILGVVAYELWAIKRGIANWERSSTDAHSDARRAFYAALPADGCVTSGQVTALAKQFEWQVAPQPEFLWCHKPVNIQAWLRVTVEPALPFSTEDENAAFFAFDAQGCSLNWDYGSGDGTTCPG